MVEDYDSNHIPQRPEARQARLNLERTRPIISIRLAAFEFHGDAEEGLRELRVFAKAVLSALDQPDPPAPGASGRDPRP